MKKKVLCIILVSLLCSTLSTHVLASENQVSGLDVGGKHITQDVIDYLEENKISIHPEDSIDIIESITPSDNNSIKALLVKHFDNDSISYQMIIAIDTDEQGHIQYVDVPIQESNNRGTITISKNMFSSKITVTCFAGIDLIWKDLVNVYYYPYLNQFSYVKNSSCTVSNITTQLDTNGSLWTNSSNPVLVQSGYSHTIITNQNNPSQSTYYYTYYPLGSSYMIAYTGFSAGSYMSISATVNGSYDSITFPMN